MLKGCTTTPLKGVAKMTMTVRSLRLIASFALLGALVAGALIGWQDFSFDPRLIGAFLGAAVGIAVQARHAL
jgi:hypothetical protein